MKTPLFVIASALALALAPLATAQGDADTGDDCSADLTLLSDTYTVAGATVGDLVDVESHLASASDVTANLQLDGCADVALVAMANGSIVDSDLVNAAANASSELTVQLPSVCVDVLALVAGDSTLESDLADGRIDGAVEYLAMAQVGTGCGPAPCDATQVVVESVTYVLGGVRYTDLAELEQHLMAGQSLSAEVTFGGCSNQQVALIAVKEETAAAVSAIAELDVESIVEGTVVLTITVPECLLRILLVIDGEILGMLTVDLVALQSDAAAHVLGHIKLGADLRCAEDDGTTPNETEPTPPVTEVPFFPGSTGLALAAMGLLAAGFIVARRR